MKRKSNPYKLSEGLSKKPKGENPDNKRHPDPDDPYEESGPPTNKMPITSNPHLEEILN